MRPDLPASLCHALGRALRVDPDERIGARDMLDELRAHVHSTEARAALAGEIGRARRHVPTIPDGPLVDPNAPVDPEATSRHRTIAPAELLLAKARPRLSSDTPTAIVAPVAVPLPPRPATRAPRRRLRAVLGYAAAAALVALPMLAGGRSVPGAASAPRMAHRVQGGPSARSVVFEDVLVDAPTDEPDGRTGLLETPESMANHRVFVDGLARGVGGALLRVACGLREVRLGSAGRVQWVRVPCNGRVSVMP
jgi:hypothetical protein